MGACMSYVLPDTQTLAKEDATAFKTKSMRNKTGPLMGLASPSNQGEKDMELSKDSKEGRNPTAFVAFGILIGSSVGAVLFSLTQNVIWLAILPGLGVVVGAVLDANRR